MLQLKTESLRTEFIFVIISYLGFTARQDYFTHFEQSQSLDGAKTEDSREKSPDHSANRTRLEPKAVRWRAI